MWLYDDVESPFCFCDVCLNSSSLSERINREITLKAAYGIKPAVYSDVLRGVQYCPSAYLGLGSGRRLDGEGKLLGGGVDVQRDGLALANGLGDEEA